MYLWIVIVGGIFSFFAAAGIGANDAANAFATSVGSKALTMRQAVFLAAIFETAGAILMGNHVTDTIRKGIADHKCFEGDEYLLMYGCMWVIFISWYMVISSKLFGNACIHNTFLCRWNDWNGYGFKRKSDCVIWYKPMETFPYVGGVGGIVMSWFISPVFSGLIACFSILGNKSNSFKKIV